MKFSLRRSLCIMLLVVATAFSSYADLSNQQLQNLLNSIASVYDIISHTQNNNGTSTAWFLNNIRDILQSKLASIQSDVSSQSTSLDSLSTTLSGISDLVQTISDSMSSETDIDFSEIITKLDSLQSAISSYSSSVSSIESLLSALSSNQVNPDELLQSITNVWSALSSITTYPQFSSEMSSLKQEISDISARLDSTLDVSGQIDISSGSLGPVVQAVQRCRQKILDFETYWRLWYRGEHPDQGPGIGTWGHFFDLFQDFVLQFDSALTAIQGTYAYLTGEFKEEFHDVWTNSVSYLPFLTNIASDLTIDFLTNELSFALTQVASSKMIPYNESHPVATLFQHLYYQLVGTLRSNFYQNGSVGMMMLVPGSTSSSQISDFFKRGTVRPSELESYLHNYNASQMEQRRFMYNISNTVPYIEGLPYRKASLSDDGDGWVSAWGNYNWNTDADTISLTVDGRRGGHTPWNNQYFATDYFADLLKFLVRTNLLQNAAYYDSVLAVLGVTNSAPSYDEIEPPEDLDWEEPSDVQKQLDELPDAEHILPTEFETVDSPEYSSFLSTASDKLGYALNDPVEQQSDVITLFPRVPSIRSYSAVVPSPELLHFEDYMTASDRRTIHDIFSIIWRLIYYVFAVYKVTDLIKSFFVAS